MRYLPLLLLFYLPSSSSAWQPATAPEETIQPMGAPGTTVTDLIEGTSNLQVRQL
jgi:hypothetical protein